MSYKDHGYAAASSIHKKYHGDARHWILEEDMLFAYREKFECQCEKYFRTLLRVYVSDNFIFS